MNEPVDLLITVPLAESLIARLQSVSLRLNIHQVKASKVDDIPPDTWTTTEVLYTARVVPSPEMAPNLRWIQFHFAGVDHAREAPILRRPNLLATTMSGASASQVAEYVLMMLLAHGHRLPEMLEQQRKSNWPKDRWERFSPLELRTSTVGIVGYGSIGRQVARLLYGFGAQVMAAKRDLRRPGDSGYSMPDQGDPNGDYVHRLYPVEALRSMVKECDFVVVATPLTAQTRGLIDAEVLGAMKPTAVLVDVSRGGVVDHGALLHALREKKLGGAALDVFPEEPLSPESPLWKMPNVIISPHISGNTPFYDERAVDLFAENLRRYLTGEQLLNRFNPETGY
jgi:phosphoglycerate dehydrogenase-like enzyme